MKKHLLIVLTLITIVAAILFYDQVLAIFHGMSVLEAMQFIITFVLHVAVTTICVYAVYTLPEIVGPWVKTLRKSRRSSVKRRTSKVESRMPNVRGRRMTVEQAVMFLAAMQAQGGRGRRNMPTSSNDDIHIEF